MKTPFSIIAIIMAMLMAQVATADETQDQERNVLRGKLTEIETALNEKAFDRLIPLLADEVVIIFLNGEVARGIDQVQAYFNKTLGDSNAILSDYNTQATVGAPARFIGNIAIADGSTQDTFTFANGSEMVIDTFWTVTLEKQAGEWKILQLQFSSSFFDNPLVAAAEQKLIMFAGIALLIGVVGGFFIGRRRSANA